jgi:predicted dehydrogenase
VIFQSRFLPSVEWLKRVLAEGRLGRILVADAQVKWFRTRQYYESAPWRGTLALDGGGALINQSIHTLDLLQHLAGPVHSVFGMAERQLHHSIEGEDTAVAVVKFQNGALGVIEGSTSVYPGFSRRLELHGDKGSVVLEGNDIRLWAPLEPGDEESDLKALAGKDQSSGASDPMSLEIGGHQRQLEDFIEAISRNRPPRVDGREGMKSLSIVLAIYRSAREKRMVEITEMTSRAGSPEHRQE